MTGSIKFSSKAYFTDEPENFLIEIAGDIFVPPEQDDDDEENILVGRLHAFYADIDGAAEAGFDLGSILDLDGEAVEYSSLFDGKTQEFVESIEPVVGDHPITKTCLFLIAWKSCRHTVERVSACIACTAASSSMPITPASLP